MIKGEQSGMNKRKINNLISKAALTSLSTSLLFTSVGASYAKAVNESEKLVQTYDESGAKLFYTYDDKGNIIKETTKDKNNKTINELKYEYNEQNQVTKTIDFDNNVTEFSYNKEGQVVKIKNPEKEEISVNIGEDGEVNSLILNKTDKYQIEKSNYIDKNAGEKETDGTVLGNQITEYTVKNDKQKLDKVTTFDDLSRLRELKTTDGEVTWVYNQLTLSSIKIKNKEQKINQGFIYDQDNNVTDINTDNGQTKIEYNEEGQITKLQYKNGVHEKLSYDKEGKMIERTVYNSSDQLIHKNQYNYDDKGNVIGETTLQGKTEYNYDENNQLIEEKNDAQTIKYQYDLKGNLLNKEITNNVSGKTNIVKFNYNKLNQFESQNSKFNANGQLEENNKYNYIWDEAGRLAEVKNKNSGEIIKYKYDEYNRRIQKQVGNDITNYVYDDSNNKVLYETDNNHNITKAYTYLKNGEVNSVSDFKKNETFYYHHNIRGDVTEITNSKGQTAASYEYDSWGNVVSENGYYADENDIRYAGYKYDKETELYYLMHRYYDSSNHTFLSRDPWYGSEDELVTHNGYNYANNNPLKYYDPTGQNPIALTAIAIPGIGEVVIGAALAGGLIYAGYLGFQSLFSNHKTTVLKFDIPNKLLKDNKTVNLGAFDQKVKGKKAYKNKKTGWTVEKDTAGHGGRKWKLKDKNGKRVASLDGKGRILSK